MASLEEKVEEHFKGILDKYGIRHYGKTEKINQAISEALKNANSKSGGNGNNYPDIQLLLQNSNRRDIPVMVEAKGTKNRLELLDKDGVIVGITYYKEDSKPNKNGEILHHKGDANYDAITKYAVNGAYHYGNAILKDNAYNEVIIIGINGTEISSGGEVLDPECKAYYLSKKNNGIPKHIKELDNGLSLLKKSNIDKLYHILDKLSLTENEIEKLTKSVEASLEEKVKSIHQRLYDDAILKDDLTTNEKLYLFCGLIMAGLPIDGVKSLGVNDFSSNNDAVDNDGKIIIRRIESFLTKKGCSNDKIKMIMSLLSGIFEKEKMWMPINGESIIKNIFKQVKEEIIPCLDSDLRLDFTGKILNSLNDWVSIDNDKLNDVVLTPRYITDFMAKLTRTNKDSFVWDRAMGSGGFLVSAMNIMIKDAQAKIHDNDELIKKIKDIKEKQILGVEILGNIYILAVLNMILMGDGSSNIICGNSHKLNKEFPANVFLLNPPYSSRGKGFDFVEETLKVMTDGYAAIIIQENAGSNTGLPYTKNILRGNTLLASIHMPDNLFGNKASVQTAIYLFQVARPHEIDDIVTFIDFSNDGYSRQNRKKSTSEVNLRDTDHAAERYAEVEARILGKNPKTNYYTQENGLLIKDCISLDGNDWTFNQHKDINTIPTESIFKDAVAEYLSWKVNCILNGEKFND